MIITPEMERGLFQLAEASIEAKDTPEEYKTKRNKFINEFKTTNHLTDYNIKGYLNRIISKSHTDRSNTTYCGVNQYNADILTYIWEKLYKSVG